MVGRYFRRRLEVLKKEICTTVYFSSVVEVIFPCRQERSVLSELELDVDICVFLLITLPKLFYEADM